MIDPAYSSSPLTDRDAPEPERRVRLEKVARRALTSSSGLAALRNCPRPFTDAWYMSSMRSWLLLIGSAQAG